MLSRFFILIAIASTSLSLNASPAAEIDLRQALWGNGDAYRLDGQWDNYSGQLLTPEQLTTAEPPFTKFPVPGVWGAKSPLKNSPPALGVMTYRTKVLIPNEARNYYLYLPDMPSAYRLWVNGKELMHQGTVGTLPNQERPAFGPKVLALGEKSTSLSLVLQVSNFHYREGGIWFSLKLTDESGRFDIDKKPIIGAVFFGAILLAIGLYNLSMFLFRRKETAALYFGLLCLVVGLRRLLIDERVIYLFDWFSWETLQRLEHLCFYLSLPLFMNFFASMYRQHIPTWTSRVSWALIIPFVLICVGFTNRVYTELNIAFQVLVLISVTFTLAMYIKTILEGGKNVKTFGISLTILALTVTHDVLKSNGILSGPNIAHFGLLAFVISQSISLQRRYLRSLGMVEKMSSQLGTKNQELLKLDEFKDEFLATTSHELRTPLQGISGLAKALQQDTQQNLNPDQKQKINLIANTSERLRVLVNDILDFSSIKHGKLKLHTAKVDLVDMSELVMGTLRGTLADKALALTADVDEECRYINADAFRLQQVLFNIIGNAAKYTEVGQIHLVVRIADEQIFIEISDTGVGIPAEKLEHLFKPFEQTHVDGHFSASGTGLGLSISRKLVELHGGTLTLTSAIGKGTQATISLPATLLRDEPHTDMPKTHSLSISHQGTDAAYPDATNEALNPQIENKPVIYVVDDEAINRELMTTLLKPEGYDVKTFSNGIAFLKALTDGCPDLVVLDYMMPGMNGLEVCRSIREKFDPFELPVVIATARHQVSDIVQTLSAGANDYLVKPFHDQEFTARIKSQLLARKNWLVHQENQKLRNEINRRLVLEEQLEESNTQLLQALDLSQELIIQLDEKFRISYANQAAVRYFSPSKSNSLIGFEIDQILSLNNVEQIKCGLLAADKNNELALQLDDRGDAPLSVFLKPHKHQHRTAYTLLFIDQSSSNNNQSSAIQTLHEELSKSRQRMDDIESVLKGSAILDTDPITNPETSTARNNPTLPTLISTQISDQRNTHEQKESIAGLLRLSLSLWEQHTGKTKFDLAEQSRCWRVYVDGTTVKARTFDRYLAAKSVPDRPRWRAVVRTAHFVLGQCPLTESDCTLLRREIQAIEEFFA